MLAEAARHFLLALQFFTRIPVTGALADWAGYTPARLRAAAGHFPGIGWIVGAWACTVFAAARWLWGDGPIVPLAAAAASTAASAWLTGAFHEDGLADTADGLGGSAGKARALEIMKDSRIGSYGALALCLAVLGKIALLAVLDGHGLWPALLLLGTGHVFSRFFPLLLIRSLVHVGDDAHTKSKPLAERIATGSLLTAALWCLPPLVLLLACLGPVCVAAGLACALAALGWLRGLFLRRLGGFTGDCLGAAQQLCEIAFYAGAAAALR
ncbi:adenosylcobinamide-GDP ribazoletransferase [Xylophilus rhododendri]|uniref:Adenosylcobinamide-GDP ribazoletransferase n=1 Tax=Xylophilus rhododendri TaxID=2697032 RepID=A0A857J2Y3_9BURK|nr:adenosylcobinamide-GDP ribazoletransferase [Xylophilus rhododendri]QHI98294.1 adenosylcobinamide-GDP ribazoletransferase [Xylophilus rhododendri]